VLEKPRPDLARPPDNNVERRESPIVSRMFFDGDFRWVSRNSVGDRGARSFCVTRGAHFRNRDGAPPIAVGAR